MLPEISSFIVQPIGDNRIYIFIELEPHFLDKDRIQIEVYSSEDMSEWMPEVTVNSDYLSIDIDSLYMPSNSIRYYFKAKVSDTLGQFNPVWSNVVEISGVEGDAIVDTMRYKYELMAESVSGVPILYFIKKRGGLRCPVCWDPALNQPTKSQCDACYGTGFYKGFYPPYETFAILSNRDNEQMNSQLGVQQDISIGMAIMGVYPVAKQGDVIYDVNRNRLWEVKQIPTSLEYRGIVYAQKLTLIQIEQGSVVSDLVKRTADEGLIDLKTMRQNVVYKGIKIE